MYSLSAEKREISIEPGATCISSKCHVDRGKNEYTHYVASDGRLCIACHEMVEQGIHRFDLRARGSQLCFMCHDGMRFQGATLHGPVTEGDCLVCHRVHGSDRSNHLRGDQPELCFQCHVNKTVDTEGRTLPSTKDLFDNRELNLHKPFAEGECTACHRPHVAERYRRVKKNYPAQFYASYTYKMYDLCWRCHEPLRSVLSKPRTLTGTSFRNGDQNLHYKHVNRVKGRTCRACHHHHGSLSPKLVRKTFVFGKTRLAIRYEKTETGGRCAPACHAPVQYNRYSMVVNMMKPVPEIAEEALAEVPELSLKSDKTGMNGEHVK